MGGKGVVTKTVRQYSKELPDEVLAVLRGIASDYGKVKQYVYRKYSGIGSMDKLTPVYTILNEMRYCGLRTQLDLPVVYYELAVADGVADIKKNWGMLKHKLRERITQNKNLSGEERRYLRTVLKVNSVYAAILNREEYERPQDLKDISVDEKRMNNMLRRMTRKHLHRPEAGTTDTFKVSPAGYSYGKEGLRLVCRIPRKRLEIPLRDSRQFQRQMIVKVRKEDIELTIPIETHIKKHPEYRNVIFVHLGNSHMMTVSNGHVYGKELGGLVYPETERLYLKNRKRSQMSAIKESHEKAGDYRKGKKIETNNLGRKKYERQKRKARDKTYTYINREINRMLAEEKPKQIVTTLPVIKNRTKLQGKEANRRITRSLQGYVRERLRYKCMANGIQLTEINAKGTGSLCSSCGSEGRREKEGFVCDACQSRLSIALNGARNIEQKYKQEIAKD